MHLISLYGIQGVGSKAFNAIKKVSDCMLQLDQQLIGVSHKI